MKRRLFSLLLLAALAAPAISPALAQYPDAHEGDYIASNFQFKDGETLRELRLHYLTFGKPVKDAQGRVTNAVLIMHGTGGSGRQFLAPIYAGELFGPGQLLDAQKYFI